MNFRAAVDKTPHLQGKWQPGLQALRAEDKPHVEAEDPRYLRGSVDIDSALEKAEPNAHRWDFAIAYKHTDRKDEVVYFAERHSANDHGLTQVVDKAKWLIRWLESGDNPLNIFERDVVWVASGATTYSATAHQKRRLAQAGVVFTGSRLRIRNER